MQYLLFKIIHCLRIAWNYCPDSFTSVKPVTAAAGFHPLTLCTFSDKADVITEWCLNALYATAHAVYHLRSNLCSVESAPQLRCFLSQSLIIINSCNAGITLLAVKTAISSSFIVCASVIYLKCRIRCIVSMPQASAKSSRNPKGCLCVYRL